MASQDFARYLNALIASWEGLAFGRAEASVLRGAGYVAARFPEPYLNNAVLLTAEAVEAAASAYKPDEAYALWCLDDDGRSAEALSARGYVISETTRPMIRNLAELPEPPEASVTVDADPQRFAKLIGVPAHLLRDVPGLRVYADASYASGLALQRSGDDVHVSMVFTQPQERGRGLATAVLTAALRDARERGARTATLQSTPMAEDLYLRHGFRAVGRWQEWVRLDAR